MIYEPEKGVSFYDAVKDLKKLMVEKGRLNQHLLFNGIQIIVSVDSNPDDIATIYDLKHKLRQNNIA